ncbi:MAG TPA: FecR domain-containing protein, partial [Anseongella sp.]|nr:FecR domain-containing protein [Anseongella sp.]
LPDGSGAWLNAASSIRFPAMFTGPERKVEITGEVYFEITSQYRDSDSGQVSIPFIVIANNQAVEVLGTHFNINAYPNEGAIKTTLLEGAVKVTRVSAHKSLFLKPGQQSLVPADLSKPLKVSRADLESTIAWKNGQFHYNMEGIATIMRQVERWYDVEVVYEGSIPKNKFVGTVSRDLSLARFLDILSYTGVNFRIEGRKIVVLS